MWLVWPSDIQQIEDRYIHLTRCERRDPTFLRSAGWIAFRKKLIRFLEQSGEDGNTTIMTGDTLRMAGDARLVVLVSYPEDGIAEVEVFLE
jgi:hypothetical protein